MSSITKVGSSVQPDSKNHQAKKQELKKILEKRFAEEEIKKYYEKEKYPSISLLT